MRPVTNCVPVSGKAICCAAVYPSQFNFYVSHVARNGNAGRKNDPIELALALEHVMSVYQADDMLDSLPVVTEVGIKGLLLFIKWDFNVPSS